MKKPRVSIEIVVDGRDSVYLSIFPESGDESFLVIDETESIEFGESSYQLQEGDSYQYGITPDFQIKEIPGVILHSLIPGSNGGRITPGNYTGTLFLEIIDDSKKVIKKFPLEIRSKKTSYRQDYRIMLEDISEKCTDLLMLHSSPVVQSFIPHPLQDPKTLYQRFTFIKSIVNSEEFAEAIQRILSAPVTRWFEIYEVRDIRRLGIVDSSVIRQIVTGSKRVSLPDNHPLRQILETIPESVTITSKIDTTDNIENQFVKYVLSVFSNFSSDVRDKLKPQSREYFEALQLEEILNNYLNHPLFKGMSTPTTLPLNNPVLQRKEGYREVLRVWLLFDLAAKLIWHGGEDVYEAGKRDVAKLYEYWLFFKLVDLLGDLFTITPVSLEKLIVATPDGLGLTLKSGKHFPIEGVYDSGSRKLSIKFSYNRTFSGDREYPASGSWALGMRPDYTLTIWPEGMKEENAEEQELITHLHFDAKYRIETANEIFKDKVISGNEEDNDELKPVNGSYKRDDILKMHAYKDAIRRTAGAYVLYPGSTSEKRVGFHEIIPGLGAFPIRPSKTDDGSKELMDFIREVINHFVNRANQSERISYHVFDVLKEKPGNIIQEVMPEYEDGVRVEPPEETSVIIGYCKDSEQHEFIRKNGLYNCRMENPRGSLRLEPKVAGAEYLLIHQEGELITGDLWEISPLGPQVYSKEKLEKRGYINPSDDFYLVFNVKHSEIPEFNDTKWDISKLQGYGKGRASGFPFAVTLTELMKVVSHIDIKK